MKRKGQGAATTSQQSGELKIEKPMLLSVIQTERQTREKQRETTLADLLKA